MMIFATFAAIALFQQPVAYRVIDASDEGIWAVDTSTIRKTGSNRTFWVATVLKTTDPKDGRYNLARLTTDCDDDRLSVTDIYYYNGDGTRKNEAVPDQSVPARITPGSRLAIFQAAACDPNYEFWTQDFDSAAKLVEFVDRFFDAQTRQ